MDNRYYKHGCPALMQDKRFLTNYIRGRVFDQTIRNINTIDSSQDYKLFLQQNADIIINRERAKLNELYTCNIDGKCVPLSNNPNYYTKYSCGCKKQFCFLPTERHVENTCRCHWKLP